MRRKWTCTTLILTGLRSYEDFRDFSLEKGASVPPLLAGNLTIASIVDPTPWARMIRNYPLLFVHATFKCSKVVWALVPHERYHLGLTS